MASQPKSREECEVCKYTINAPHVKAEQTGLLRKGCDGSKDCGGSSTGNWGPLEECVVGQIYVCPIIPGELWRPL